NSFNEVRCRSATDRIRSRACHESAHDVPPTRKEFQDGPCAFAKQHCSADICAESSCEFCGSTQAAFASAHIHDSGNHHHLQTGQDRQVGERDRLCANGSAHSSRRFDQEPRHFSLPLAITRNPDHFHTRFIRQLACKN